MIGGPGSGDVTLREMVAYVTQQLAPVYRDLEQGEAWREGHDGYHRDLIARETAAVNAAKRAATASILAVLTCLCAVASVVVAVLALH